MFVAILIVPLVALTKTGGVNGINAAVISKDISTSFIPKTGLGALIRIISTMAWGLGYFGQPHILVRFMSIKNIKEIPRSTAIATVWVFISLAGAILVGLIGTAMYSEAPGGMVTGAVVLVIWKNIGLGSVIYEIVPGFITNFIVMFIINAIVKPADAGMEKAFDEVRAELKA